MRDQAKPLLLTIIAVFFWSTAATAFKIALVHLTPYTLLFYSALVSSLALFVIIVFQGKFHLLFNLSFQEVATLALLGFLNPFFYYTILFAAYSLLPGQIAMSINYGWPFALTLLSVPILKQRLNLQQVGAIIVSFVGAAIIATRGSITDLGDLNRFGLVLVFSSTVIWASFWLLNARDRVDPVIKLFLGFCFGLLFIVLFSPLLGPINLPEPQALLVVVYIGLFEMGVTFVVWLTALQISTSAARISNLIYLSPFLSLLFLHIFIGEAIHKATIIGLVIIVGSILYQEQFQSGANKR